MLRHVVLAAALLSTVASPVLADEVFRMDLEAPIYFVGGTPGNEETPPEEPTPVDPLVVSLQALPTPLSATEGQPFTRDMANQATITGGNGSVGIGDLVFTMSGNPAWLSISSHGILTGTPTAADVIESDDFEIVATHTDANDQQTYTITVNGVTFQAGAIASGQNHTCAIVASNGGVKCWGNGANGRLGNGLTANRSTPVDVSGLQNVKAIAAGFTHTCAITSDNAVKCWGRDNAGQLGNNASLTDSSTPVDVSGLTDVKSIASGVNHTCAITNSNTLKCWGANTYGQLGNGGSTNSPTPVEITALAGLKGYAAGSNHSCAITSSNTVKCWGLDSSGQLGNDAALVASTTPVDVVNLGTVQAIASGQHFMCAISSTGTAKCWGDNGASQLGSGIGGNQPTPVSVQNLTGVRAISGGSNHACAIVSNGTVKCWGDNGWSQIGDGTGTSRPTPVSVNGLANVSAISAGSGHTCAVSGSTIKCWGLNNNGQLGDNSTDNRSVPVGVSGFN